MTESALSNVDLAQRVHAGDKRAEEELFKRFGTGVRQILIKATGSLAMAEDLCQETLIVTLQRLRTAPLDDPSKLPAFVAQIARNLGIAEKRRQYRRRTEADSEAIAGIADGGSGQEADVHLDFAATAVRAVLQELRSERDRLILTRYYLHDDDREVICRELGLPEATFKVVLFRARARFLELLERRGIKGSDLFCLVLA